PARVHDVAPAPGAHPDDAAGSRLGLPFRSADQRHRRAHQPPATEDRRRRRPSADPYGARRRLRAGRGPGGVPGAAGAPTMSEASVASRSLLAELRTLFRSVGFRLALNYGLLSIMTMAVLIALFYIQTIGVIKQGNARLVMNSVHRLENLFDREGREGVAGIIEQMLADGAESDNELYLLLDETGAIVTGNLDAVPDLPSNR